MKENSMYFKHPDRPYATQIRNEIIIAAEEKSKTCDLTLALLNIIEDDYLQVDNAKGYDNAIEELESEITDLKEANEDFESDICDLRHENKILRKTLKESTTIENG